MTEDRPHTFEDSIAEMRRMEAQQDLDAAVENIKQLPDFDVLFAASRAARRDPDARIRAVADWLADVAAPIYCAWLTRELRGGNWL